MKRLGHAFVALGLLFAAFGALMLLGMLATAAAGDRVPFLAIAYLGISPFGMGLGSVIYGANQTNAILRWPMPAWMRTRPARIGALAAPLLGIVWLLPITW